MVGMLLAFRKKCFTFWDVDCECDPPCNAAGVGTAWELSLVWGCRGGAVWEFGCDGPLSSVSVISISSLMSWCLASWRVLLPWRPWERLGAGQRSFCEPSSGAGDGCCVQVFRRAMRVVEEWARNLKEVIEMTYIWLTVKPATLVKRMWRAC